MDNSNIDVEEVVADVTTESESIDTFESFEDEDLVNDDSNEESSSQEGEVDYKAELEALRMRAEKAEKQADKRLGAIKRMQKSFERKDTQEEGVGSTDKVNVQEISKSPSDIRSLIREEMLAEQMDQEMRRVATNDDEYELMRTIAEQRLNINAQSLSDVSDIVETAKLLANKSKFKSELLQKGEAEGRRKLAEKELAISGSLGSTKSSGRPLQKKVDSVFKNLPGNLSPMDRKVLAAARKTVDKISPKLTPHAR